LKELKANGKLLITGEYLILDGALSLASPCKFGQSLKLTPNSSNIVNWYSQNHDNNLWFDATFTTNNFDLIRTSDLKSFEWLKLLLNNATNISNKIVLKGAEIRTKLEFDKNWGLGSSSTLINVVAQLFNIDPFELHFSCSNGSGYDIACASANQPITYQIINQKPEFDCIKWDPQFSDDLFFIHLNQKQNSTNEVNRFSKLEREKSNIDDVSGLTKEIISCKELNEFEKLISEHEKLIGYCIKEKPIKENYFFSYRGAIKSLGAWGGDFILATRNNKNYFSDKGFNTIIPFNKMIKNTSLI
jgi:mevalonate kinase